MSKFLKISYDRDCGDGTTQHISGIFPIESVVIRYNEKYISFYCAYSNETLHYRFNEIGESLKHYQYISRIISTSKVDHQLVDLSLETIRNRLNLGS